MNIKFKIFLLFVVITFSSLANATRPFISMEQIIEQTPVIFEANVLEFKNVKAPNREMYFTYDEEALEISLQISKSWKGAQKGNLKAYTWALGKAPCTGIEIKKNSNYLIYAELDKSKKNLMFDFCRGFRPTKAKYVEGDLAILKRLFQ
jgi:hypothetical protein